MKIYICDDKTEELKKYESVILELSQKHGIQVELFLYQSGKKLLFDVSEEEQPDIVYLDIHMPEESGVDVAESLRKMKYQNEIIFVTVSEDFMLNGFDVEALHYIIKNKTTMEKFEQIFLKAFKRIRNRKRELIHFSCAGKICTVSVADIKYFAVDHRVVTVYYEDKSFEFYSPLEKIENMLAEKGFIRTHRSFVVSFRHVVSRSYDSLTLDNGVEIPIGRAYAKEIKEIWSNYEKEKTA